MRIFFFSINVTYFILACEQRNPTMASFLGGLESSGWLRHIKSILDTSLFISESLLEGISVLVHCSDGWDRTAQVCSLASILLDPFYRTLSGYQVNNMIHLRSSLFNNYLSILRYRYLSVCWYFRYHLRLSYLFLSLVHHSGNYLTIYLWFQEHLYFFILFNKFSTFLTKLFFMS